MELTLWSLEKVIEYSKGLEMQGSFLQYIASLNSSDVLLLLRHEPVITRGKRSKEENILVSNDFLEQKGIPVFQISRGGEVTYHGPGQLMGYPLINLDRKKLNVPGLKSKICQSLITTLEEYGIKAEEGHKEKVGLWVDDKKIASIGFGLKKIKGKTITHHGFALYVLDEMENFNLINPCGMPDIKLTNMERLLGEKVDFKELKEKYSKNFAKAFGYDKIRIL